MIKQNLSAENVEDLHSVHIINGSLTANSVKGKMFAKIINK
jgi:hypothetical protein